MRTRTRSRNRTDHTKPARDAEPPTGGGAGAWPAERKLRLFACGCCRQWWESLAPVGRQAVEAAERYADGRCRVVELEAAWRSCRQAERLGLPDAPDARTTEQVHRVAAAVFTPADAEAVAADLRPWRGESLDNVEVDARCERVRADVFGPPADAELDPSWLTPAVAQLARAMYEARDFGAMPLLADALRDAGCDGAAVLGHCRDPQQVHVRGCWVVDRILGSG